jgi:hypothetical protein
MWSHGDLNPDLLFANRMTRFSLEIRVSGMKCATGLSALFGFPSRAYAV